MPTENGSSPSVSTREPEVKSSYWVMTLAKARPSTTTTVPWNPHRLDQAMPISIATREMWKTRLPASRM